MILDPISLATRGLISVTPTGDRCPTGLSLLSAGIINIAAVEDVFTYDAFRDQQTQLMDQILREDEEIIIIAQSLAEAVRCRRIL